MSRQAERLLEIAETDVVNRHVGEFLVPAEADSAGTNLAVAADARGARRRRPPRVSRCARRTTFGVRYWARDRACGPPRAALVVLADAG